MASAAIAPKTQKIKTKTKPGYLRTCSQKILKVCLVLKSSLFLGITSAKGIRQKVLNLWRRTHIRRSAEVISLWQGHEDLNLNKRFWRALCYRYTMPPSQADHIGGETTLRRR